MYSSAALLSALFANLSAGPQDLSTTSAAVPQPELPICSRCNLTKPPGYATSTDPLVEVNIQIDPSYSGDIIDLELIIVSADGSEVTVEPSSSIIAAVNNARYTTTIEVDGGDVDHVIAAFRVGRTWTEEAITFYTR